MPFTVDLLQWQINAMEEISAKDRDVALKHLSKIKGRSNVMKNYRGKLLGIGRMNLIENKIKEEIKLQEFINSNKDLSKKYGTVIGDIRKIYEEKAETAEFNMLLSSFNYSSDLLSIANNIYRGAHELQKDDVERESAYMDRNIDMTKKKISLQLDDYYAPSDKVLFKNHLERVINLPDEQRFQVVDDMFEGENAIKQINNYVDHIYTKSKLSDKDYVFDLFGKTPEEIEAVDDPFIQLAVKFYPYYQKQKEISEARKGTLDKLYAKLIDVKKDFLGTEFVPDANRTLRLTYG